MPLTTEYHLTVGFEVLGLFYRVLSMNEPYSKVSGDFNPVHHEPLLCHLCHLARYHYAWHVHQVPLLDGMRETVVAKGVPDHVFK